MPAAQLRLIPDARPLVDRLGEAFFRTLPTHAGVYLMRDATDTVLYVGKARNLRQRLGSYRVANPDHLPRRLLRLLAQARRIEWQACADEAAALTRERALIRELKPRFNRAGVWPATPRFLAWRDQAEGLELTLLTEKEADWEHHGPLGGGAVYLRALLARVLWLALHPERGVRGLPAGWFAGCLPEIARLPVPVDQREQFAGELRRLLAGGVEPFGQWLLARVPTTAAPFDRQVVAADLEQLQEWLGERSGKQNLGRTGEAATSIPVVQKAIPTNETVTVGVVNGASPDAEALCPRL